MEMRTNPFGDRERKLAESYKNYILNQSYRFSMATGYHPTVLASKDILHIICVYFPEAVCRLADLDVIMLFGYEYKVIPGINALYIGFKLEVGGLE